LLPVHVDDVEEVTLESNHAFLGVLVVVLDNLDLLGVGLALGDGVVHLRVNGLEGVPEFALLVVVLVGE